MAWTVGATNIVEFNFNNGTKTGAITNNATFASSPYTADNGIVWNINTSIISLIGWSTFDIWTQWADLFLASSPNTINRNNWDGSKYWMINFSTIWYWNLTFWSKQRSSNTWPRDFKVQYNTWWAIWTDVPSSSITVANNFTSGVLSGVTLPSELNNQPNIYLRWIMTSNTSVNSSLVAAWGTQRIDDIIVEWVEVYTLNYTGWSNWIVSWNLSQTVFSGDSATTVSAIANTGYYFVNRSDGSTANPRTDTNITWNISVTANFAINQYLVAFQDYNSSVLSTGLVNHGSPATPPSNPTRTGYTFSWWNPSNFSNITWATTITAQYAINQYTITFFSNGGTNISPITGNYNTAVITPSNPTRTGYTFNWWNPTVPTTIPAQNITVTGQWIEVIPSVINTWTVSGGGWGNSSTRDNCPNWDYTSSYYDGSCGTKPQQWTGTIVWDNPISIIYSNTEIYNNTIPDEYCYDRKNNVSIIDSLKISTNEEFKKALTFLYSYDMTMFNKIDEFSPSRTLTREEAAKIFSNFAINVLCRKADTSLQTSYTDINNTNETLKPYITKAYQLWLMKWWEDQLFRPKDIITKAEFNAVLIRLILKGYLPENKNDLWYSEYNSVASDLGIIKYGAGYDPVIRNDASLMLFRAYKNQLFSLQNIDYKSFVLQNRDQFIQ